MRNSTGGYLGAPYGGWEAICFGQEECFEELMSYTQIKNVNMRWQKRMQDTFDLLNSNIPLIQKYAYEYP